METYDLIIVLIIATLLQVCTANPASVEDETNGTKLFTEAELQRAENIGLTKRQLIAGKSYGFTFEEMLKMYQIEDRLRAQRFELNIDIINEFCAVLVPEHIAARDYTPEQESKSVDIMKSIGSLPDSDQRPFYQKTFCSFVSQPSMYESDTFGMTLKNYLRFRYFEGKNENSTGTERVNLANALCRIYSKDNVPNGAVQDDDIQKNLTLNQITDEFEKLWKDYQTTKTSTSFVKVCNFLGTK